MIIQKYRSVTKCNAAFLMTKNVNERGTEHIKQMFGGKLFAYPKSEFLLNRIIELATNENEIVSIFILEVAQQQLLPTK